MLGVAAQKALDGALAVGHEERAEVAMSSCRAAACLSSSFCSWPCAAGQTPTDARLIVFPSQIAPSEWTLCRAAFA